MLRNLHKLERCDRTIHDDIHEYCLTEKVKEVQLRVSIKKKERKSHLSRLLPVLKNILSIIK